VRPIRHHACGVAEFFRSISNRSFRSEAAAALQERLIRNREKLFTFLDHDQVPWNNNSAENAIKQFAYYRQGTVGVMTISGLNDYLVLLSIYQTCRYKRIIFLQFMLSKQRVLDSFHASKPNPRRNTIEVYPKGYTPPHLTYLAKRTMNQEAPS